jgi:hypothetical protein
MNKSKTISDSQLVSRRSVLASTAATVVAMMAGGSVRNAVGSTTTKARRAPPADNDQSPKAFVYTELPMSSPFTQAIWQDINIALLSQPGLLNKTWLTGSDSYTLGGFYAFNSIENAQLFVTGFFPEVARGFGVAQTSRIFDTTDTEEAGRDLGSPFFGAKPTRNPGAFVYTEVQVNVPFKNAPWRERNPALRHQPGLVSKTWLSGLHTQTLGGIDVFDSVPKAKQFALNDFPRTAKKLNAAFYTRVFDARIGESASRHMSSPFFI